METIKGKALKLKNDIEQLSAEAEHLNELREELAISTARHKPFKNIMTGRLNIPPSLVSLVYSTRLSSVSWSITKLSPKKSPLALKLSRKSIRLRRLRSISRSSTKKHLRIAFLV